MDILIYEKLHRNLLKMDMGYLETRVDGLLEDIVTEGKDVGEILNTLLEEEINFRMERSIKTRIKLAKFPYQKTIDDFDFSFQPELDQQRVKNLFSLKWIRENGNVVFLGPPGVGKTHLAISLGMEACKNGFFSYFLTFQDLIEILKKAEEQNRLHRKIQTLGKYHLLIIDEMGYLPLGMEESNLLFQLVSKLYLKSSIILTSNRPYGEWGEVFPDESIAAAILDRLLENSMTVKITGDSYRIKQKRKLGLFN
jgi:DNA replication protein DnaC